MRLGQLARKLDVSTNEIVKFCASELRIEVLHHPNTKVPDESIDEIINHFGVNEEIVSVEEDIVLQDKVEQDLIHEKEMEILETVEENQHNQEELTDSEAPLVAITENDEEIALRLENGVIKAPKIELPKPKVVGKIDLPAPKIPVEQLEEEVDNDDLENNTDTSSTENSETDLKPALVEEKPVKTKRSQTKKSNRTKGGKKREVNVLTYEEEVRLKKEAYEKQRAAEIAAEKERKKRNYEQLMKNKQLETVKPKKKKGKNQETTQKREVKAKPTSLWGRFLYWLNN